MASTNGRRMWKPASSVARYRPSRSTTNALCCGTTTAVREMTKSASSASTRKTISASDIVASPSLLRLEPERQAVHPRHFAALPAPQRALAFVPRGPRRAAELRLADLARRQVVEQHGHLADEDVDARGGVVSRRHPAEQPPAERHEEPDRDEREEEPLDPSRSARSERCQHTDGDRAETEEEEEEAARRHDFAADQRKAEQHPQPPRHPWRHGATERKGCQIDAAARRRSRRRGFPRPLRAGAMRVIHGGRYADTTEFRARLDRLVDAVTSAAATREA